MQTLRPESDTTPQSKGTLATLHSTTPRPASPSMSTASTGATTTSTAVASGPTPDVLFTTVAAVRTWIDTLQGDALVVGNVSASDFRAIERERDVRGHKYRLFYLSDAGCLIITVPTAEHEDVHLQLWQTFTSQVASMGLLTDWRGQGSTTYPGPGGSSGEGDSGGHPRSKRRLGDWPTLVIESGYSQTMPSLYAKMRWWFSASTHQVKVVVLAKMFRSEIRLHIERWQEVVQRPGATATRRATTAGLSTPQPRCIQTVDVCWARPVPFAQESREIRESPDSFRVEGGPLTIEFGLVFLRAPVTGESNFVVEDGVLRVLAASAFQRQ